MRLGLWPALGAAPLLVSCVFLLDYDDLQSDAAAGRDERGGAAGASSQGDAGAAGACGDCDDGDPCTIDGCEAGSGAPSCSHRASVGLVLDGLDTQLDADEHLRVSLVGSGQLFYLSALARQGRQNQVSLYRFGSEGGELEPILGDLSLEGSPVSNVGLALEELSAGEVALHGFVATKLRPADSEPRVFHVQSRAGKTTSTLIGTSYKADDPRVFPQALNIGGKVVGAWIQADGTIGVRDAGALRNDTFGDATLPASTLALLSTSSQEPAILFTTDAGAGPASYVELAGQKRTLVPECESAPGSYRSSSVVESQLPGLWLASITRAGDDYSTTGSATLLCGSKSCSAVGEDCQQHPPHNFVRDVAEATIHFDADEAGVVYSVTALPQAPAENAPDTAPGRLSLLLGRTDFSAQPVASEYLGGAPDTHLIAIAEDDSGDVSGSSGPDWPAVAILPGKQVAVAWIQPGAASGPSTLRVQRYKMCLPVP